MDLATLPLFQRLEPAKSVLLAGAGGGVEITPDSSGSTTYFPEQHLARWLGNHGEQARVFAFEKTGVAPLRAAYEALIKELGVDTLVLVDGGTDSLLRGDEAGLGTPSEDMTTIAAADDLELRDKLLVSIGFGVDAFHGVSHGHVLEAIAALSQDGGYLGAFSLLPAMKEFELYKSAVETANAAMREHPTIVNTSILSAVEGDFGNVHRIHRTQGSELWINPLMSIYFAFDLAAVARRVLYLRALKHTQTMFEVSAIIDAFQRECEALRPWVTIPI